jgi:hypothetical protein
MPEVDFPVVGLELVVVPVVMPVAVAGQGQRWDSQRERRQADGDEQKSSHSFLSFSFCAVSARTCGLP